MLLVFLSMVVFIYGTQFLKLNSINYPSYFSSLQPPYKHVFRIAIFFFLLLVFVRRRASCVVRVFTMEH